MQKRIQACFVALLKTMQQTKYIFLKLAIARIFGYMRNKFIFRKAGFIL